MISADGGGSNGSWTRLWKVEWPGLADETGLWSTVCHLPPGTSKGNKSEPRAALWPADRWVRRTRKEGSQGPLGARFAALRGIAVRAGLPGPEVWLVLRRHLLTGELKTYLCNAPADTPLVTLVRLSGMRWPIETYVEDVKQDPRAGR